MKCIAAPLFTCATPYTRLTGIGGRLQFSPCVHRRDVDHTEMQERRNERETEEDDEKWCAVAETSALPSALPLSRLLFCFSLGESSSPLLILKDIRTVSYTSLESALTELPCGVEKMSDIFLLCCSGADVREKERRCRGREGRGGSGVIRVRSFS